MEKTLEIRPATGPSDLISQAIDKGLGVAEMEKLLAMQERWEANQARKEFFGAFSRFQSDCPELRKTKSVEFGNTKYSYAPIGDISRQIGKTLKENDLSYRWEIVDTEKEIKVTCLISHVQGHTERTTMTASPDTSGSKNPIQARGSAIEYLKRYTLIGALGLTTADTDIDGRLPELDVDKLHKQYMDLMQKIVDKKPDLRSQMDPDNWAAERTADLYLKAIGKARQILIQLTPQKP